MTSYEVKRVVIRQIRGHWIDGVTGRLLEGLLPALPGRGQCLRVYTGDTFMSTSPIERVLISMEDARAYCETKHAVYALDVIESVSVAI